jgi:hypothetical protein
VCFNLEEELPWPSGDAEGACAKQWGLYFAVKHLRFYPSLLQGSVQGPQRELPLIRTFLFLCPGHLRDTFKPIYPERLWIEEKTFCNAFPFHIVFDEAVRDCFPMVFGVGSKPGIYNDFRAGKDFEVTEKFPGLERLGFTLTGSLISFHVVESSGNHNAVSFW